MKLNEFVEKALRTETKNNPLVNKVIQNGLTGRTLHSIMGIETELGELKEAIDKIDIPNIIEELGDILWYLAIFIDDNKIENFTEIEHLMEEVTQNNSTLFKFEPMKAMVNETLDICKKTMFYNKEFTLNKYEFVRNIILGVGTIIQRTNNFTFSDVMETVIKKLEARYPEKFTDYNANNRNLNVERKILEKSVGQ